MKFRDLSIFATFDWIDPNSRNNSFYLRCTKISGRWYQDENGTKHRVGSINAAVYHVTINPTADDFVFDGSQWNVRAGR